MNGDRVVVGRVPEKFILQHFFQCFSFLFCSFFPTWRVKINR